MNLIQKMVDIKTRYNTLKCPKTKAAKEKYWDKQRKIRREMSELIDANEAEISALVVKHHEFLNVMAPVGGPLFTGKSNVTIEKRSGNYFQLTIDGKWVGLVHLMENQCGMDNVLLLAKVA